MRSRPLPAEKRTHFCGSLDSLGGGLGAGRGFALDAGGVPGTSGGGGGDTTAISSQLGREVVADFLPLHRRLLVLRLADNGAKLVELNAAVVVLDVGLADHVVNFRVEKVDSERGARVVCLELGGSDAPVEVAVDVIEEAAQDIELPVLFVAPSKDPIGRFGRLQCCDPKQIRCSRGPSWGLSLGWHDGQEIRGRGARAVASDSRPLPRAMVIRLEGTPKGKNVSRLLS